MYCTHDSNTIFNMVDPKYDFCVRQYHDTIDYSCHCYCSTDFCNKELPNCYLTGYFVERSNITLIPAFGTKSISQEFYYQLKHVKKLKGYLVDEEDQPINPPTSSTSPPNVSDFPSTLGPPNSPSVTDSTVLPNSFGPSDFSSTTESDATRIVPIPPPKSGFKPFSMSLDTLFYSLAFLTV